MGGGIGGGPPSGHGGVRPSLAVFSGWARIKNLKELHNWKGNVLIEEKAERRW